MKPILFQIGDFPFYSWYVFFCLAMCLGYFCFAWLLLSEKHVSADDKALRYFFLVAYISGWLGARALSIFVEQFDVHSVGDFFRELLKIGSMTFYGGFLTAWAAASLFIFLKKKPYGLWSDAAVIGVMLGLAVGRIGCFLNGDDYGKPVPFQEEAPWWAVKFPVLNDNVLRFPTQLQESFFCFGLVFLGIFLWKNSSHKNGSISAMLLFFYAGNRFVNEFFRGDMRGHFPGTELSTSQGVSLMILAAALLFMILSFFKSRKQHHVG